MSAFTRVMQASPELPEAGQLRAPEIAMAQPVSWAGMALPLVGCAAIWSIDNSSALATAWLSVLHGLIGAAAAIWTVLRLHLSWRTRHAAQWHMARAVPPATLLLLYVLLILHPAIAIMANMFHGNVTALFGVLIPSFVQKNQSLAKCLDTLHGWNALMLLVLIAIHMARSIRGIRRASLQ